jgi:hypothetical protein
MKDETKLVYVEPKQLECGHNDTLAHDLVGRVMTAFMIGQRMGIEMHTILAGMETIVEAMFTKLGVSNNHFPAEWRSNDQDTKTLAFRVRGNDTIN